MRPSHEIRVLLLERDNFIQDGAVHGKLYINGVYFCDTLENEKTLVSHGVYDIEYSLSPRFGRKLPLFYNNSDCKPERGLRLHAGNSKNDSKGCILLGERYWIADGSISNRIKNSKTMTERLCSLFETDNKVNRTILVIGSM